MTVTVARRQPAWSTSPARRRRCAARSTATGSFTQSAVYACVRCLIERGIPNNGGYFRPIAVKVPTRQRHQPGPAGGGRGARPDRLSARNAVFGALAQVAPRPRAGLRVRRRHRHHHRRLLRRRPRRSCSWSSCTPRGAAGRTRTGSTPAPASVANFSNNPIEYLEGDHPLRIEEYAFVPDTGGAGQYRGGLAMVRQYRFLEREGALQLRTDRQRFQPWGLAGGKPGTPSSNLLIVGGVPRSPPRRRTASSTTATAAAHDGRRRRPRRPAGARPGAGRRGRRRREGHARPGAQRLRRRDRPRHWRGETSRHRCPARKLAPGRIRV